MRRILSLFLLVSLVLVLFSAFASCDPAPRNVSTSEADRVSQEEHNMRIVAEALGMSLEEFKEFVSTYNQQITTTVASRQTSYRYAASSESNVFHYISCFYVNNIHPENLIYFSSRQNATNAGYRPCTYCNP